MAARSSYLILFVLKSHLGGLSVVDRSRAHRRNYISLPRSCKRAHVHAQSHRIAGNRKYAFNVADASTRPVFDFGRSRFEAPAPSAAVDLENEYDHHFQDGLPLDNGSRAFCP